MKPLSTIAIVIALGLALGACTSESTTMAQDEPDGVGGSDYGTATQTASIGGSSVAVTTVVQVVEVPKLSTCVPGAQTGCVCTDGSPGAQVCQDDGTMGVCECGEAPEPVETFPKCVSLGTMMAPACDGIPNEYAQAYLNCPENPNPAVCVPMKMLTDRPQLGAYCCPS